MNILPLVKVYAKKEYAKHDANHQWAHVEEVMDKALYLAKFYPEADLEILKTAVILHDVIYENYETHVDDSLVAAENFLRKTKYDEAKSKKVLEVMVSHSGPHRRQNGDTNLIEGKILYDADKYKWLSTKEGFEKYFNTIYLKETKELFRKEHPELF